MNRTNLITRMFLLAAASALAISTAAAQTNPVKLVRGIVTDTQSGRPVGTGRLFVYAGNAAEPIAWSRINPGTGAFQVVLGPSTSYRFVVKAHRCLTREFNVTTPGGNEFEEISQNFELEPIPVGKKLLSINAFDPGSTSVRPGEELRRLVEMLKDHPAMSVTVTVASDAAAAKARAPKAAKKKKGKKGTVAADTAVATASETGAEPSLAQKRQAALKALFNDAEIASSRVKWQLATAPGEIKALGRDDVVVTISGVKLSEAEDE